ncbi:fungal-specific transcription factor domain-containing protein [Ilyonectria sp. MPI-CAGE-AT-0026]|nr:fungal-specific transcription factor domain-containing protein [Ilyonectria sp. MPI-CAGE-AT-0026]
MRYYISVLATHLTVSQEFNSFLTAFLPMAMESVAFFNSLLALTLGHMSLSDETYKVAALETRSTAIRNLAVALSNPSDRFACHETNAAACLAFLIYEAGVGDCRAWYTHLKGTHHVIVSASEYSGAKQVGGPEALKNSIEGQWVLRNFAYHDIIGSITLRKKPLLNSEYLVGITDVVDSCLGVAAGLLHIIARISCLEQETESPGPLLDDQADARQQYFRSTYTQLEQELLSWRCHIEVSLGLEALAFAYRNAALIMLYRLMRYRLRTDHLLILESDPEIDAITVIEAKIQAQVVDTLGYISQIPVGTPPESALLFPVFIVGGEALQQDEIDPIRTRLQLMAKKRQFRNLLHAREVLEDLWDLRKTRQGANADWTQILDASGEGLLLT